ncbi:hypothetical protein PGB90_009210 [Kerria lacca]
MRKTRYQCYLYDVLIYVLFFRLFCLPFSISYFLRYLRFEFDSCFATLTQQSRSFYNVKIRVSVPPHTESTYIVAFLNENLS